VYPQSETSARIACGTDKGRVLIVRLSSEGVIEADKEHFCMGGAINQLIWTPDGKALIALGEGAGAINPENGHHVGDILGHTAKILCGVLNSEKVLFSAGEGNEILRHEGPPFKGQGRPIKNVHTGYINQMVLSPNGSKFATVSADKSVGIYDAKTGEIIKHLPTGHTMGVYDLVW